MEIISVLNNLFQQYVKECSDFLGFSVIENLPKIVVSEEIHPENSRDYGVEYVDGTIKMIADSELYEAILRREAFWFLMPYSARFVVETKDLAWEYARLKIDDTKRETWNKLWEKVARPKVVDKIKYYPTFSFPIFSKLTKGNFIRDIVTRLYDYEKYQVQLTTKMYLELLEEYMVSFEYPFNELEVRILEKLAKDPEITAKELANKIHATYKKVQNTIRNFKKYAIIYPVYKINYNRLGMVNFAVLLRTNKFENLVNRLLKNPFLYSYIPFYSDRGYLLATYIVPKSKENLLYMKKYLDNLSEQYNGVSFRLGTSLSGYNFRFYNTHSHRWAISWNPWTIWAQKTIINEYPLTNPDLEHAQFYLDTSVPEEIDKVDLKIINNIKAGFISIEKLRKKLNINMNKLVKRLQLLEKMQIIKKVLMINMIGLTEIAGVFLIGSEKKVRLAASALSDMPLYAYSLAYTKYDEAALVSLIFLPKGELINFARSAQIAFSKLFETLVIAFGGPTYYSQYKIDESSWDNEKKRWLPHPKAELY
ncbi:MAG: hypothetical protein ACP6IU_13355 [Candidatus Asgardarchaeia archaeon]